jgi:hypothetical protein
VAERDTDWPLLVEARRGKMLIERRGSAKNRQLRRFSEGIGDRLPQDFDAGHRLSVDLRDDVTGLQSSGPAGDPWLMDVSKTWWDPEANLKAEGNATNARRKLAKGPARRFGCHESAGPLLPGTDGSSSPAGGRTRGIRRRGGPLENRVAIGVADAELVDADLPARATMKWPVRGQITPMTAANRRCRERIEGYGGRAD